MIVVITSFNLPPAADRATLVENMQKSIPVYEGREGLVRKYIAVDADAGLGRGIYLWETREQAEAFYEMARPIMREEMGQEPDIRFFDCPIIVDNDKTEVWVDPQFGQSESAA